MSAALAGPVATRLLRRANCPGLGSGSSLASSCAPEEARRREIDRCGTP
jgi:hypothetical protein